MLLIIDDKLRSHTLTNFEKISNFLEESGNIKFTDSIIPENLDEFNCIAIHSSIALDTIQEVTDFCVYNSVKKIVFSGGTNGVLLEDEMSLRINDRDFYNWLMLFEKDFILNGIFNLKFFLQ